MLSHLFLHFMSTLVHVTCSHCPHPVSTSNKIEEEVNLPVCAALWRAVTSTTRSRDWRL